MRWQTAHGEVVVALIEWFASRKQDWGIRVLPDVRTQTSPTRFRIPDVLIVDALEARHRRYVTGSSLIAIEVLSPDDTRVGYLIRIADFRMMGIADIWIFDPPTRIAYAIADDGTWQEQKILSCKRRPEISVDADRIFQASGLKDMASVTRISMPEFLARYDDSNVELIDGVVRERSEGMTRYDHNDWIGAIYRWFVQHAHDWHIGVAMTQNVLLDEKNRLVPDVVVFDPRNPREQSFTHPPIAVFEVTSDDDAPQDIAIKLAKYERWGVSEVWQVYPETREFRRWHKGSLTAQERLTHGPMDFAMAEIAALLLGWGE